MTIDQITQIIKAGNEQEVRQALLFVTGEKRDIEKQLAKSKGDMLVARNELMQSGANSRDAQMHATSTTDPDWRARATWALKGKDELITRLKSRLAIVLKDKGPPKRQVVTLEGDKTAIAAGLQYWLDEGWVVMNTVVLEDAVLAVLKKEGA